MFVNLLEFTAKVGELEGRFILPNGVGFDVADQMATQFTQALGIAKAQQAAQVAAEKAVEESKVEPIEQQAENG